ncbi:MAG: hypothetical protein FIB01_14535 [Gemmatimonadetes bacterium]|nr:hypothetical protein [Gemmatimonadota bacterium]
MNEATVPPAERTYRYPAKARWSYAAAAAVTGAMATAAVGVQLASGLDLVERGQLLVFTAVFLAAALHAADAARTMAGRVRMAHAGLGSAGGELVPWSAVSRVDIRPLRQRMDVYAESGRRLLVLRPELEAFAAVQSYIIDHMQPRPRPVPCTIPLLAPLAGAPIAVLAALLAVLYGPERGLLPPLLLLSVCLVIGLAHLARRGSIEVTAEGVALRYGWRRYAVPFGDITAVHVQARPRSGGGAVHYVVLERDGVHSIPIAGFRHGYHEAFQCIEAAWRAARAHTAAARG